MSSHEDDHDELVAYSFASHEFDAVPAQRAREWMVKTGGSFANRCLPLLMANESGWWLLNRHAFTATWNGGPRRSDTELQFDDDARPDGTQASSLFGYGILTWGTGCVFRTPPGVDLLVRGPANLPKDGVAALEGLVEADWIEVPFTVSWKLTRPGLPVRFEQGEPFAMVVPQGRRDLERYRPTVRPLTDAPELLATVRRWTERGEREQIRTFAAEHVPDIGGPEWDGTYLRGATSDGSPAEDHRVRRELQPFTSAEERSAQ